MLAYPAVFEAEEGGGFSVSFPDIYGCHTQGDTLEEAQEMAQEALTLNLEGFLEEKKEFPTPSDLKGENVYLIEPDLSFKLALWLQEERKRRGWTQKYIAELLKMKQQYYQVLEDPAKSNPNVLTIQKIEKALGKKILILES
jgi:antitoxin HicB